MIPAGYGILLISLPLAAVAAVWAAERVGIPIGAAGSRRSGVRLVAVGQRATAVAGGRVLLFLPPLVYYAAVFHCTGRLRANARSIGLLSVGLVVVTTAAVAGVLVGLAGVPLAVALITEQWWRRPTRLRDIGVQATGCAGAARDNR